VDFSNKFVIALSFLCIYQLRRFAHISYVLGLYLIFVFKSCNCIFTCSSSTCYISRNLWSHPPPTWIRLLSIPLFLPGDAPWGSVRD